MNVAVDFIVTLCIRKNIIKEENIAWFRYGLEKRIVTLVVGIPFVLMGIAISNIWTALSFFLSFFFLRTRMNGYHAKSILGCLICSLALELLFLGGIAHWINNYSAGVIMALVLITTFTVAPYNHSNMHLTSNELSACKIAVRIRYSILLVILGVCILHKWTAITKGIASGCAMAGTLLCFAYIIDWRTQNGETADKDFENN